MRHIERNLVHDEQVLYKTGSHWIVLLGPILLGFLSGFDFGLIMLVSAIISIRDKNASSGGMALTGLVFLVIGAIPMLLGHYARRATEIAVTNKRIVIRTGLLSRRTFELLLPQVENIVVEEGILGRMLGYGSVVIRGIGGTPESFHRVAHPLEFVRQVQQLVGKREQRSTFTRPSYASPGAGTGSGVRAGARCGAVMTRTTAVRMTTAATTVRSEMVSRAMSQPRKSATTGFTNA